MTYRLLPCPIAGHQVSILSLLTNEFLVCSVVDMTIKVWTSKNILDHLARVPVPNVVLPSHPFRSASSFRERAVVLQAGVLP